MARTWRICDPRQELLWELLPTSSMLPPKSRKQSHLVDVTPGDRARSSFPLTTLFTHSTGNPVKTPSLGWCVLAMAHPPHSSAWRRHTTTYLSRRYRFITIHVTGSLTMWSNSKGASPNFFLQDPIFALNQRSIHKFSVLNPVIHEGEFLSTKSP